MSIWCDFKIRENYKSSGVSVRKAVTLVMDRAAGGEFSISKYSDDQGYYFVSCCLDGESAIKAIREIIELGKTIDTRSNLEVEIVSLKMF